MLAEDAGSLPQPQPTSPLSPDERAALSGTLAFVSEREGKPRVYLIDPSGENERPFASPQGATFPAAASADGKELLIIRVTESAGSHLEQLERHVLASKKVTLLGDPSWRTRAPSFSPDGRFIVFESAAQSTFADLFRIGKDGKGLRRLTQNPEGNFEPCLAPDGKNVVFVSSRDGDSELYRMGSDGSKPTRLTATRNEDTAPRWSPDGQRIAFISTREGTDRVFVIAPDGTSPQRINPARAPVRLTGDVEESWEADPTWSPDGKKFVFTVRVVGEKPRLWLKDFTAPNDVPLIPLSDGRARDEGAVFSPDGRYLAFVSDRSGDTNLWVMRANGTGATMITSAPGPDWKPLWIR